MRRCLRESCQSDNRIFLKHKTKVKSQFNHWLFFNLKTIMEKNLDIATVHEKKVILKEVQYGAKSVVDDKSSSHGY